MTHDIGGTFTLGGGDGGGGGENLLNKFFPDMFDRQGSISCNLCDI